MYDALVKGHHTPFHVEGMEFHLPAIYITSVNTYIDINRNAYFLLKVILRLNVSGASQSKRTPFISAYGYPKWLRGDPA
jgi:hypothetical protein